MKQIGFGNFADIVEVEDGKCRECGERLYCYVGPLGKLTPKHDCPDAFRGNEYGIFLPQARLEFIVTILKEIADKIKLDTEPTEQKIKLDINKLIKQAAANKKD